jgi:hypothetical protein
MTLTAHLMELGFEKIQMTPRALLTQKATKMAHVILMAHLKDWNFHLAWMKAWKTRRDAVKLKVTQRETLTLMAQLNALVLQIDLKKDLETPRVSLAQKAPMKAHLIQRVKMTLTAHLMDLGFEKVQMTPRALITQNATKMAHVSPRAELIPMAHLEDWNFHLAWMKARKTRRDAVILKVTQRETLTLMAQPNALARQSDLEKDLETPRVRGHRRRQ